jgi:hypothetical protein
LLLLVPEVPLVPLQIGQARLGLQALLLGRLQLGHQAVHVVAHGDCPGQPGLGGRQLRDLEQQVLALGATGGELLGVGAWSRRYCSNF